MVYIGADSSINTILEVREGTIVSVHDGDTCVIKYNGAEEPVRVRITGIDSPENTPDGVGAQPYGKEAGDYLASMINGAHVSVEYMGKDRYDRDIGYIVKNGVDINAKMIEAGYAWHYREYSRDDKKEYYDYLENKARTERVGLWRDDNPEPPWGFRKKHKAGHYFDPYEQKKHKPTYDVSKLTTSSQYVRTYTSYSGHDMVVIFEIPLIGGGVISRVIGECQTISYSVHNEKMPVRILGNMNPKSYVFGNRTIAGSMIFTVFDEHWSNKMLRDYKREMKSWGHTLDDELPPINVTISMANEYGDRSRLALYGVTFVNEGQVMSINDVYTENTFQFYAMDVDYLTSDVDRNWNGANNDVRLNTINKKIEALNYDSNAAADIPLPISAEEGAISANDERAAEKDLLKEYDVYDLSPQALSTDRNDFMINMDQRYRDVIASIESDEQLGKISQEDKMSRSRMAKKIWMERRSQADSYYADREDRW